MLCKRNRVHNTGFHSLKRFGCGHRCWHAANTFKRLAQATCGAHAHAFKVGQRRTRLTSANEVVLWHGRGHQQSCIPLRHFFDCRRVRINGLRHGHFLLQVFNAQERQFQHGHNTVFVTVVARTKLRHFKRTNGDPIKVFAVLGQTAVADVHSELAAGFFRYQLSNLLNVLCKGAAFTPDRNVPFGGGSFADESKADGANGCAAQKFGHVSFSLTVP